MLCPNASSKLPYLFAVLSFALTSCGSAKKPPPALDRATFIEETSIKLPSSAEILDSRSSIDDYGTHYHVMFKLPKSAESVLGQGVVEDPKFRTSTSIQLRQMDMASLSSLGITLKDPNVLNKTYVVKTKSKGTGDATAYTDGETIYVLANFGIKK
ncbi:MAG: hypothetical protein C0467_31855 [Planctomycetaceae bacterium]|nr:hypothetical protein [Planctomycetaceae bacterium]